MNSGNIKKIQKLQDKKHRKDSGLFVVEGEKNVLELINSPYEITELYLSADSYKKYKYSFDKAKVKPVIADEGEIQAMSSMATNTRALAVVKTKEFGVPKFSGKILALVGISDPGNLGTIVRIADWYGIETILCSTDTVDMYNPKTVAASMGSLFRLKIHYGEMADFLKDTTLPILGATLDGNNAHNFSFPEEGILLVGSESHGIPKTLEKFITEKVTVPRHGKAESLNAAIATAILCDNWLR